MIGQDQQKDSHTAASGLVSGSLTDVQHAAVRLLKRTGVKRELSSLRNSEPMVEEYVDGCCDPPKWKVGHMWSKLVSLQQF